ncbi:MAG: hypothetical protein KC417_18005, partial [Myxococcales bacterium]|nr:hypothetical protein [Myxococcales bacterium]
VLAPANVLAHNLLRRVVPLERDSLTLHRASVGFVTAVSLALAYVGEDAYALLESSYELGMVSLLAPLVFGLYGRRRSEVAALASMVVGTALWLVHVVLGLDGFLGVAVLPQGLMSLAIATTTYAVAARVAV